MASDPEDMYGNNFGPNVRGMLELSRKSNIAPRPATNAIPADMAADLRRTHAGPRTKAEAEARQTKTLASAATPLAGFWNGRPVSRGEADARASQLRTLPAGDAPDGTRFDPLGRGAAAQSDAPQGGYRDRSGATERERAALQKRIDDQISSLGPLNMRSKRDLVGQLLGLKQRSVEGRMDQLGKADSLVADVEANNASLRDRSAARRQQAEQFAEELDLKRRGSDQMGDYLKMLQDDRRFKQGDREAQDAFDEKQVSQIVSSLQKQNPELSYEDARAQATQSLYSRLSGTDQSLDTTAGLEGMVVEGKELSDRLSRKRGFWNKVVSGDNWFDEAPLVDVSNYDVSQLQGGAARGIGGVYGLGIPFVDVVDTHAISSPDGNVYQSYPDEESMNKELERLRRFGNQQRRQRDAQGR